VSSDWLFAAEFVLTAGLVLGFAWHQLHALKKLREERERKAREAAARGDEPKA
jgi:hypothetical protein